MRPLPVADVAAPAASRTALLRGAAGGASANSHAALLRGALLLGVAGGASAPSVRSVCGRARVPASASTPTFPHPASSRKAK